MNNLLKNIGIWLVIGLVVLTVVKQFDARQGTKDSVAYSEFMDSAKAGKVESATVEGRSIKWMSTDKKRFVTYSPGDIWMVGDLVKYGVKVEAKPEEEQSFLVQIFISWFPMLLLIGVWIFFMRQMQGGGRGGAFIFGKSKARMLDEIQQHGHFRRRRRLRRGQGRSCRTGRVPARPHEIPEARRAHSARRADGRLAGHRQDAARQGDRRRGEGAVLLDLGLRLRRDVRRRRRRARARHVRAGEEERAVHRVHRRDRRGRSPARRGPRRRQRRARADAQPVAGRDGRLRGQRRASSSSPRPTVPTCSTRRCCGRAASTARWSCRCPTSAAASRSCCVHMRKVPIGTGRQAPTSSRAARPASPARTSPTSSTRRRCSRRATSKRLVDMIDFERAKDKIIMGAERRSLIMPEEERKNTAYHESGHAIVARAAAQDRPGAQGDDHSARPCAGRDDAAARAGPLQLSTATTC